MSAPGLVHLLRCDKGIGIVLFVINPTLDCEEVKSSVLSDPEQVPVFCSAVEAFMEATALLSANASISRTAVPGLNAFEGAKPVEESKIRYLPEFVFSQDPR